MKELLLAIICAVSAGLLSADEKGIEYARPAGHALLLDLHVPDGPGPFPAAILVHGGGFDGGSRGTNMAPTFQPLADAGFAWFSIDYRMAPEFRFPEAREDVDTAIRWVKANASTYRVDPAKILLAGESAGGFLVNYAATHETPATRVAAVVDIYGPVDYERIARQRQAYPGRFNMASINAHQKSGGGIWFFGVEGYDEASFAKLKEISPLHAVHKGMPPFLAVHGTRDDQVPYRAVDDPLRGDAESRESLRHHHRRGRGAWYEHMERRRPAALQGGHDRVAEANTRNQVGRVAREPMCLTETSERIRAFRTEWLIGATTLSRPCCMRPAQACAAGS